MQRKPSDLPGRDGRDDALITLAKGCRPGYPAVFVAPRRSTEPDRLTAEDRQEAALHAPGEARHRFETGRAALRSALARVGPRLCTTMPINRGEDGKPGLPPSAGMAFSLSHAGGWVALALMRGSPVGIDAETLKPVPEWPRLVRRWPAPEQERVAAGADPSRAFLEGWTAREAILKCHGRGLGSLGALDGISLPRPSSHRTGDRLKTPWGGVALERFSACGLTIAVCRALGPG